MEPQLNFAIWPANSEITLVNVPWDQQSEHAVRFDNRAALDAYIDSRATENGKMFDDLSYHRASEPIKLQDPFNTLWKYNYLRVSQPAQQTTVGAPDEPLSYYYYITSVNHLAPNTTQITVQLDIYQTFIYDVVFGTCYIDRSHLPMAQNGTLNDNGRRYLSIPEGLDTGSDMVTLRQNRSAHSNPNRDMIIYSTSDLTGEWEDSNGYPITPGPVSGGAKFGENSGIGVFVVPRQQATNFFNAMTDYPHIAQTIVAAVLVPEISYFDTEYDYPQIGDTPLSAPPISVLPPRTVQMFSDTWRDTVSTRGHIPERFRNLNKLYTFPYTQFILSYGADNTLTLRPEQFYSDNITIELRVNTSLADMQCVAYPRHYTMDDGLITWPDATELPQIPTQRVSDMFVTTGSLPSVGTAKDSAALTLASTAHTRAFQSDNADYSREKALRAASTSYAASRRGMEAAQESSDIGAEYNRNQGQRQAAYNREDTLFNSGRSLGLGVAGGAVSGMGPAGIAGGAAVGAANAAMDIVRTDISNRRLLDEIGYTNARDQSLVDVSNTMQGLNAAGNLSLANFAAQGDYQATIGAIEAQVQDTQVIAPSMVAMPQGSVSAALRGELSASVTLKMMSWERMWAVGNYWLRYGYAVQEFITPPQDTMVMSKFTYWKMTNCNIRTSPMPEMFKNVIRGIFEKGVTIYRDPDDIGVVDIADNDPIMGDYY